MKKLKKVFLYFLSILIISTEISIGLGSVVLAKESSLELIEEEKTSIDDTIGELSKLRELIEVLY
ncbi:hypothetical protein [Peptoniphilus stercorisuis]|uniref:Methyl-accepting chemotaxis protein n=1 Tax=Peptoniphilus stercorisuis TaxID=1436965 RepID=A0ABS4KDD9_9FIRM|nr:hypothetical protein [Peptoniphilus stercorisuis]MBP2025772.1 hypothetical protein [Peptoniphilus stercorisuis]